MGTTMADAMRKAGIITNDNNDVKEKAEKPIAGKRAVEAFRNASPDNPMFANISVYREDIDRNDANTLEWRGVVACTGVKNVIIGDKYYEYEDRHASFRAIEDGELVNNIRYGFHPKKSVGFYGDSQNFIVNEYLESTPELLEQYHDAIDAIKVTVHYSDYEDAVPSKYLSNSLVANEIKGTSVSEIVPNAHSLIEGERWMIQNHPGQLQGMSISTSSGDFHLTPVPSTGNYPDGQFENRAAREIYAKEQAAKFGVEVGKFDYSKADAVLNKKAELVNKTNQLTDTVNNLQVDDLVLDK